MKLSNDQRKQLREVLRRMQDQVRQSIRAEQERRSDGVVQSYVEKSTKARTLINTAADLAREDDAHSKAHAEAVKALRRKVRANNDALKALGLTVKIVSRDDARCESRTYRSYGEYGGTVNLDADCAADVTVDSCTKKDAATYVQGRMAELFDAEAKLEKLVTQAEQAIATSEFTETVTEFLEQIRALEQ